MSFPNHGLLNVYGAALPAGMKEDMMSQLGQKFLNQPQQQPQAMQAPQAMQNDAVQQRMAEMKAQQDQANAYKMMGQGIQNYSKGMQMPMPSANTAQIMRDNNQFRMAGTPQQQMAQALRKR